jgi:hypothetical protein
VRYSSVHTPPAFGDVCWSSSGRKQEDRACRVRKPGVTSQAFGVVLLWTLTIGPTPALHGMRLGVVLDRAIPLALWGNPRYPPGAPGGRGPARAPPNLYPFKENPFFGSFQGIRRYFCLAPPAAPGRTKGPVTSRKYRFELIGKPMTSDHSVAGSSPAGYKSSLEADLQAIMRLEK